MRYDRWLAVGLTVLTGFIAHAYAQAPSQEDSKLRTDREKTWGFFVAPYGWLTGVQGTVASGVESIDIDIPFDEFLERTQAGFMLYAEDLSYRWLLGFRGDVGGFGIGDAADFSWQATAEVGFRISRRVAVGAGCRVLEYDTIEGEGDSRSGYDLRMSGAIVGLGMSF